MEISVWSSYFIDLAPEEMVQAFAKKGWQASELSDEHGEALLGRGQAAATGKQLKEFAAQHGLHFPQGHLWLRCDICSGEQSKVVERLKNWLDLFDGVGIRAAVLHPGGKDMLMAGCERERLLHTRVAALKELTAYIKGSGMTICLENIPYTAPECEDLIEIIDAVGSDELGICLDTGHLNMCSGDQQGFISKAGSKLKALHIADNEGINDQHLMPFGRGSVDWQGMVNAIKDIGYEGLFNFEIPGESRCPMEIRLLKLDYIKAMAEYMLGKK